MITLYQDDCLNTLAKLPQNNFDCIIADPPYMIGAKSAGDKTSKSGSWVDIENAAFWFQAWISLCRELLKPTGHIAIFTNWRSVPTLFSAFARLKWPINSLMIWDKMWIGPASKKQLRPRYEMIIISGNNEAVVKDRSVPDIISCKWQAGNMKTTPHPAEKPIELISELLNIFLPSGSGFVLDPFMGSGTTGIAAKKRNFQFIGIEKDPDYFAIAQKRLGVVDVLK